MINQMSGGKTTSTKMRMYVLANRQLPRRLEGLDKNGKPMGGMDYYDYDAAITIDFPPCK